MREFLLVWWVVGVMLGQGAWLFESHPLLQDSFSNHPFKTEWREFTLADILFAVVVIPHLLLVVGLYILVGGAAILFTKGKVPHALKWQPFKKKEMTAEEVVKAVLLMDELHTRMKGHKHE